MLRRLATWLGLHCLRRLPGISRTTKDNLELFKASGTSHGLVVFAGGCVCWATKISAIWLGMFCSFLADFATLARALQKRHIWPLHVARDCEYS